MGNEFLDTKLSIMHSIGTADNRFRKNELSLKHKYVQRYLFTQKDYITIYN